MSMSLLFYHHLHSPSSSAYIFPTFHSVTPNKMSSTNGRKRSTSSHLSKDIAL